MNCTLKPLALIAALALAASASAQTLFDNTSGSIVAGWGYFNSGAAWGDELSLGGPAQVTSFSFDLGDVASGFANGTLTLRFYNVDAGADGLLQTSDDKIGSLIGSYAQAVSLADNTRYTLSGFSIAVPGTFIYTVTNSSNLSYLLEGTQSAATVGSASNSNIWANFSGGLPVGTQSSSTYAPNVGNNQVLLQGTAVVPEPSTICLFGGAAGFALLLRLRRSRR